MFRIIDHGIDVAALTAAVGDSSAGAIVTFIGTTRDHNEGRRVLHLEYEAYPEMALAEMRKIGDSARQRWPIAAIAIVHRIGVVPLGEASVVIAVAAAHRRPAFEACHFAIDRLKELVPIWKKEHFEGGEIWIGSQTGQVFQGSATPAVQESSASTWGIDTLNLSANERLALRQFTSRIRQLLSDQLIQLKLFGSKARGTATAESDIDILVEVETADVAIEDAVFEVAYEVNLAHDVYISPRVVARAVFENPLWQATSFLGAVDREGVAL